MTHIIRKREQVKAQNAYDRALARVKHLQDLERNWAKGKRWFSRIKPAFDDSAIRRAENELKSAGARLDYITNYQPQDPADNIRDALKRLDKLQHKSGENYNHIRKPLLRRLAQLEGKNG